jgi:spore coat polysaccharide biosynthesis protein SpsF
MNSSAIGLVVQARMSSSRLPGKVLKPMAGRPMLGWLLERMRQVGSVGKVIIATSRGVDDDQVAAYAESMDVLCFRGSLDDVLSRFQGVAEKYQLDAMVRVSADSPFLDPVIVREAVGLFNRNDVDLVTNVFPRSFPKGQSVEIVTRSAIERAAEIATLADREHVTSHFYTYPERYRILNFAAPRPLAGVQMAVDTKDDFILAEKMFLSMDKPQLDYDIEALLELRSALAPVAETEKRQ